MDQGGDHRNGFTLKLQKTEYRHVSVDWERRLNDVA